MAEAFATGRIVDLIVAAMALEALLLVAYRRRTGRGIGARNLLVNMAAGLCLMLALRGALTGAAWVWVAACLAAGLLGHLADLWCRWPAGREAA